MNEKFKYKELKIEKEKINLTKNGFSLDGFGFENFENRNFILNSKGTLNQNNCHVNKAQILGKKVHNC